MSIKSWWEQDAETQAKVVQDLIHSECKQVAEMLIQKNTDYGSSVFCPTGIFAKGGWEQAIHVRIDDKLARVRNHPGHRHRGSEDTILDLIGYLILLRVGKKLNNPTEPT